MALLGDDGQGPVEADDRQQEKGPHMLVFGRWGRAQPLCEEPSGCLRCLTPHLLYRRVNV